MMNAGGSSSGAARRKRAGKRPVRSSESPESRASHGAPCGACRFLRRRCVKDCIFAPHFSSAQGAALFAAVHKVFGASNVSKLLMQLETQLRHMTVVTISYEAQARLTDPVYGCVGTVIVLQQQVAALQAEIARVQNQLANHGLVMGNPGQGLGLGLGEGSGQAVYPHGPSAVNNNVVNESIFDSRFHNVPGGQFNQNESAFHMQPGFDPMPFGGPYGGGVNDIAGGSGSPSGYADEMLHSRWI